MKHVSPYFVGGEEKLCFIRKYFPISKSLSLTFVVQTITFQENRPTTTHKIFETSSSFHVK